MNEDRGKEEEGLVIEKPAQFLVFQECVYSSTYLLALPSLVYMFALEIPQLERILSTVVGPSFAQLELELEL